MDSSFISNLVRVLLLFSSLFARAFFAGCETAFLAMDKWAIDNLAAEGDERALLLKRMKEDSRNTVSALLVGTNICTILFSVLMVSLSQTLGLKGPLYMGIVSLVTTATVFVFSDLMPKALAAKAPTHMAIKVAVPLDLSVRALNPAAYLMAAIPSLLTSAFSKRHKELPGRPEEEVLTVFDIAEENGYVKPEDKDVIDSVFDVKDKRVIDIMIPLRNVVTLNSDTSILRAIESFREYGYSRVPVVSPETGGIVGVLYIKDAIREVVSNADNGSLPVSSIMRKPYVVQANESILRVLSKLKRDKVHMAIVAHNSSPIGIVTMQDLLEELLGDIPEEARSLKVKLSQYSGRS